MQQSKRFQDKTPIKTEKVDFSSPYRVKVVKVLKEKRRKEYDLELGVDRSFIETEEIDVYDLTGTSPLPPPKKVHTSRSNTCSQAMMANKENSSHKQVSKSTSSFSKLTNLQPHKIADSKDQNMAQIRRTRAPEVREGWLPIPSVDEAEENTHNESDKKGCLINSLGLSYSKCGKLFSSDGILKLHMKRCLVCADEIKLKQAEHN